MSDRNGLRRALVLPLSFYACAGMAGHAIEEVRVVDTADRTRFDVAETVDITPDAAALLRKAPGANVNGNGPLTGIPQVRGMYGPRVNVEVNGATIGSGGPNWMDPPLSYAPAAQLEYLEVYRGIAPVSAGQETIGGAITAKTWAGDFGTTETFSSDGRLRIGGQSANGASLVSATAVIANQSHRFKLSGLSEQADDAEFPEGEIIPSEYDRQRADLGYGFTRNGHTLQLDLGRNETGDSGTPALPMDIQYIDSDLASLSYGLERSDWSVDGKLYYSDIEHGMTNYHLREAPSMTGMWRRNIATGENLGFALKAHLVDGRDHWRFGVDGFSETHNSNIDNPHSASFFVVNFNDASRDVLGLFLERDQTLNHHWRVELGLRYNRVAMDADEVDGTPASMSMMGMSPGATLRDNFNDADRSQSNDNIDWVAKLFFHPGSATQYYVGLAQKMRSPSYQERYLWAPMESTGGLADGRTYTGNIELDPETAYEIELGLDFQGAALSLSPRFFYREVDDYIQGTVTSNMAAVQLVNMMNMMNGTSNPEPLEFNNVDADFYGFDMDWRYTMTSHWSVGGLINIVRGKRDDIDDDLYRIAPWNAVLDVTYENSRWSVTAESQLYKKQDKVSGTNTEQETAGYGLLNLRGYWQATDTIRLGAGVDNLLDKEYRDHLSGYNRAANPDIAQGERLPGVGRNAYLRFDYQW